MGMELLVPARPPYQSEIRWYLSFSAVWPASAPQNIAMKPEVEWKKGLKPSQAYVSKIISILCNHKDRSPQAQPVYCKL